MNQKIKVDIKTINLCDLELSREMGWLPRVGDVLTHVKIDGVWRNVNVKEVWFAPEANRPVGSQEFWLLVEAR